MTDLFQNSDGPIGTAYTVIEPARLAYWDPSIEIDASTSTRYAQACYLPTFIADPVAGMTTEEFMAAMFG